MPWWCPKQKVHGIFDALQMVGSHRLNRGSHSRFSWCKGVRLGWFKQKGFGRARKIHDQAMSHVAKSSTIEIIQKPSKPVAVCHDEFICHGSSAVWLRCDWATHRSQGARSQPQANREGFNDSWKWKKNDDQNMKNERKVQTYPELLIVLKSIDQLEKRHVVSNNWGLADAKVKEFATPKNHPHCHGLSPLRGNTTGKHNGETQRGNTTGKHNDNRYGKNM